MKFKPNAKEIDVTGTNATNDVLIHVKKAGIAENKKNIYFDGINYHYANLANDGDILISGASKITNKDTIKSADAVIDSLKNPKKVLELLTAKYDQVQAKEAEINTKNGELTTKTEEISNWKVYAVGSTVLLAGAAVLGGIVAYNKGVQDGKGPTGPFVEDPEKITLESKILGVTDQAHVDAMEARLFAKNIGDISKELTFEQEVQLYGALVEQKALENNDLAKVLTNSVLNLINVTYKVPMENLTSQNLSLLQAVDLYGKLAAENIKVDGTPFFNAGVRVGEQNILNQTPGWNVTHYQTGLKDGKVLGSTGLYATLVDIVDTMLDQNQINSANGNITELMEMYKQALVDYGESMNDWTADHAIEVANTNLTGAMIGLERVASMGPDRFVTIACPTQTDIETNSEVNKVYKSWYNNMTKEDAAHIENVTGASIDTWRLAGYSFDFVDTVGNEAILMAYTSDNIQFFKVDQTVYNHQKDWKSNYAK